MVQNAYYAPIELEQCSTTKCGWGCALCVFSTQCMILRYSLNPLERVITSSIVMWEWKSKCFIHYVSSENVHSKTWYNCGFSLIRVHRFQSGRVLESTNNILLSQLKWPIETMFVGLRPAQNVAAANPNQYRDWHNLTLLTDQQLDVTASSQAEVMTDDGVAFNAVSIKHKYATSRTTSNSVVFPNSTETVDTLQLQAHGIQIFATTRAAFYRDYLPYTFGGSNIVTPEDRGALMLNFCLYPGTYQPSGHLNVSRARELYLEYVSSYVSQATPADLLVLAKAINFNLRLINLKPEFNRHLPSVYRCNWDKQYKCLVHDTNDRRRYHVQNRSIAGKS